MAWLKKESELEGAAEAVMGASVKDSKLPSALTGEMGVLKKITEETMTTTRFTQLATEWVTGDTLDKIK